MTAHALIRITCPSQRVADEIADQAIEKRYAACANIDGPVTSTYRWKDVVEHAFEFVLWLKAPVANFVKIETLVDRIHPYETPAIVALPCLKMSARYEAWLTENTE